MGLLAGITSIFPLADVLFKIIPLPVDAYDKSTARISIHNPPYFSKDNRIYADISMKGMKQNE